MYYKLFNSNSVYYEIGGVIPTIKYKGNVIVAIDPSKTNCAVVVENLYHDIYAILEFSGNNWHKGKPMDTTEYCYELSDFLGKFLDQFDVCCVGMEQAITKKGMTHHSSTMVLTEIRAVLLNLFRNKYGLHAKDVEVNNWAWKFAVLPEGLRSMSFKGSKRYYSEYLNDHTYDDYFKADVTDALCICEYLQRKYQGDRDVVCLESEKPNSKLSISIMPEYLSDAGLRKFKFNPSFTVKDNVSYFVNRSIESGCAVVDTRYLTYEDIYTYSCAFTDQDVSERVCLLASTSV